MKGNQGVVQTSSKQPQVSSSNNAEAKLSAKESVFLELLKAKMTEANGWIGHIISTSAIFSVLNVGLFKYALDANSTPPLRHALSWIGVAISLGSFVTCGFMEHLRRSNQRDQEKLLEALQVPLKTDRNQTVKYQIVAAVMAITITLIAWIYLLVTTPQ